MKRKMTAMCLAAVLLSAGTVNLTAWAEGWAEAEGNWVYYDSNGNKVYNDWKKGADGQRRYLDGNGTMAVNSWVDGRILCRQQRYHGYRKMASCA